ncbi:hypothetical protein SAY87_007354 [Trapa incisa]|uniref:Protein DA1-like domain-containing protein n=1 Tax=Trapa incisa TaxID=236973 RepID=A0AAN7K126_9MYRT|nr:hypothetical protein SAY87_007354 [Trapa incisa]
MIRSILDGIFSSSSTPPFEDECLYFDEGGASNTKDYHEGHDDDHAVGSYQKATEEELALGFQQSLYIDNHSQYDNISAYPLQSYPPDFFRQWDQNLSLTEVNNGEFFSGSNIFGSAQASSQFNPFYHTTADHHEFTKPEDCRYLNSPKGWNRPSIICDVCGKPVPVDWSGNSIYGENSIFRQKYCRVHERDGTPRCSACNRLQPTGVQYTSYQDGRKICHDCKRSAIMNEHDCLPLMDEIFRFYEDIDMKVMLQNIPVEMVDTNEIKKLAKPNVIGFTRTHELDVIETMISTRVLGPNNEVVGAKEEPFKLASFRMVEKIVLLKGNPRLHTGATLAHEMMHAWIRLEDYHRLGMKGFYGSIGQDVKEGMCEVMSYMWLESKIGDLSRKSGSSPALLHERKLANYLKHSIEINPDKEYGGGFRRVYPVVKRFGLKETLAEIRYSGKLPG